MDASRLGRCHFGVNCDGCGASNFSGIRHTFVIEF